MKTITSFLLLSLTCFTSLIAKDQPNPPKWPKSSVSEGGVFIFDPSDSDAQKTINQIYTINGGQPDNGQFSPNRYALFFKPGNYPDLTVPVGYYTSVYGLGRSPSHTSIFEVVCQEGNYYTSTGALNTFWRSAENFTMAPTKSYWTGGPIGMLWAVSQAAPLRRVNLTGPNGNLILYQEVPPLPGAGYASGGFLADSNLSGDVLSGPQQQWLTRNSNMNQWQGALWNMVFVGCQGAPASSCGLPTPYTTVAKTPIIAEKPYIIIHKSGKYSLVLPGIQYDKIGSSLTSPPEDSVIGFEKVYVARAEKDNAFTINKMIDQGFHIILSPGIYELKESIKVNRNGICILGLGYATLVATNGKACIEVGAVDDVRIASILFQAGSKPTKRLLQWGKKGDEPTIGFLYDCFVRVGGPTSSRIQQVRADVMVEINSSNIVCDNLWLWRADHDVGGLVVSRDNPCKTAFIANGDNIIAYGLAVEHTLNDLAQWNGNNGKVYFFQAEYPYDVTQKKFGKPGYVAYHVDKKVKKHHAWGVGVYSFFRDHNVTVESGIKTPTGSHIKFVNSLTRWLNGYGKIVHVINEVGDTVDQASPGPAYLCTFP